MKSEERAYRHVVLFKFKATASEAQIRGAEKAFADFATSLPFVVDFEWGCNSSPEKLDHGYSHCFVVSFKNEADRDAYIPHPKHQAFIRDYLDPCLEEACVVDFWAEA